MNETEAALVAESRTPWDRNRDPKLNTVWTVMYTSDESAPLGEWRVTDTKPGITRVECMTTHVLLSMPTDIFQMNFAFRRMR